MSTLKNSLIAIESIVASQLSGWSKIPYAFDITKNNFSGNNKRFALIPADTQSVDFASNQIQVAHGFQVLLVNNYINQGNSDEHLRNTLLDMYDLADDLIISVINRYVGTPLEVHSVNYSSTDLPEIYEEDKVCVLRLNFTLNYRKTIN